jgi:hypothetical protein
MQDDSYLESYISTIGVDFVSNSSACALCVSIMYLYVHHPSYAHVHVLSLIGIKALQCGGIWALLLTSPCESDKPLRAIHHHHFQVLLNVLAV